MRAYRMGQRAEAAKASGLSSQNKSAAPVMGIRTVFDGVWRTVTAVRNKPSNEPESKFN